MPGDQRDNKLDMTFAMNNSDAVALQSGTTPAAAEGNCLLLSIHTLNLLVPRTVVAEVIRHGLLNVETDRVTGLAWFDWRGCRVPLVDGGVFGDMGEAVITDDTRVAVFHGLRNTPRLPFYGLAISRGPRLLRVSDGDLAEITGVELHPVELMRISLEQSEACIPKVDYLESQLLDLMKPDTDG